MKLGETTYIKSTDLAENLGITKSTLKRWLKKYEVPTKDMGRIQLIAESDIETLLDKRNKDIKANKKKQSEKMKKVRSAKKSVKKVDAQ